MARTERLGPPDEKVTINLGPVDLGTIDLLVEEGFYGSRTDLIRAAVRRLLDEHRRAVDEAVVRRDVSVGLIVYTRKDFEEARRQGKRLNIRVVGVFHLPDSIDPDLADAVIERVWVAGRFMASKAVKARLGEKVVRG